MLNLNKIKTKLQQTLKDKKAKELLVVQRKEHGHSGKNTLVILSTKVDEFVSKAEQVEVKERKVLLLDQDQKEIMLGRKDQVELEVNQGNDELVCVVTTKGVFIGNVEEGRVECLQVRGEGRLPKEVHWHPFIEEYLGVLYDHSFQLYNTTQNLDSPEVSIPMTNSPMASFAFSFMPSPFDLSDYSILFMSMNGEMTVACPVLVVEQKVAISRIKQTMVQIQEYGQNQSDLGFLQSLLDKAGDKNQDVFVKLTEEECHQVNRKKVHAITVNNIMMPNIKWKKLYKIENSQLHVVVRLGQNGEVEAMVSGRSIGPKWELVVVDAFSPRENAAVHLVQQQGHDLLYCQDNSVLKISLHWLKQLPLRGNYHEAQSLYKKSLDQEYNFRVVYQKEEGGYSLMQLVGSVLWVWNDHGIDTVPMDDTQMFYSLMNSSREVQLSFQKLANLSLEEYNTTCPSTDWLSLKTLAVPCPSGSLDQSVNSLENYVRLCQEEVDSCRTQFKQKVSALQGLYSNNQRKLQDIQGDMKTILARTRDSALQDKYQVVKNKEAHIQRLIGAIMQKLNDKHFIDFKQTEFFGKIKDIKAQQEDMKQDMAFLEGVIKRDTQFFDDVAVRTMLEGATKDKVDEYFKAVESVQQDLQDHS